MQSPARPGLRNVTFILVLHQPGPLMAQPPRCVVQPAGLVVSPLMANATSVDIVPVKRHPEFTAHAAEKSRLPHVSRDQGPRLGMLTDTVSRATFRPAERQPQSNRHPARLRLKQLTTGPVRR